MRPWKQHAWKTARTVARRSQVRDRLRGLGRSVPAVRAWRDSSDRLFLRHVVLKCRTVTSELLVPRPRCYPSESRGTRIIRIRIVFFRPLAKNAAAFGGEEASEATISTARRDPAGRPQWNPSWPAR